jgi:Recombinase zinc beta ribbon domain/Recombinase
MYGRTPAGETIASEVAIIRDRIVPAFLAGMPAVDLCRTFEAEGIRSATGGRWNPSNVFRILMRPDLGGFVKVGDRLEPTSAIEPILDCETWERVVGVFESRRGGPNQQGRRPKVPFVADRPLRVVCGVCGGPMIRRTEKGGATSYACSEKEAHKSCVAPRGARAVVDGALVEMFAADIFDEKETIREIRSATDAAVASARTALASAEREVMRADERLARVRRDYQDGSIDVAEWREHRDEIAAGRVAAQAEVRRLTARVVESESEGASADAQTALVAMLDALRAMASRYAADAPDADLVASLRMAMAETIEAIEITSNAVRGDEIRYAPDDDVGARTVYLVRDDATIGVVVRRLSEQNVYVDGTAETLPLPQLERVALPVAEKDSLTWATHFSDWR